MRKRRPNLTTNLFIKEAQIIHNTIYDYSLVEFVSIKKYVKIICSKHGAFEQTPDCHLRGHGCFNCGIKKRKL